MEIETIISFIAIAVANAGGLIHFHIRTQTTLARQHERIKRLESDNTDLKLMVREVVDGIHEIRNLLAANSIR